MDPPPFLPPRPASNVQPSQAAALALRSALTNPYSQSYSSHYAQAYMQQYAQATNAQGYTLSPTYNPNAYQQNYPQPAPVAGPSFSRAQQNQNSGGVRLQGFGQANSTWYQPGHVRCNHEGCTFSGSAKSWQKKPEWDADPSLKGKPIPIQGTNLVLNSPDAIQSWIEERKKRWPSRTLIEEKKRKFDEASARGELSVEALGLFSKRRRKVQDSENSGWRGRGSRGRGRGGASGSVADRPASETSVQPKKTADATDGSSSDSDDEPEVLSSKPPPQSDIPPLQPKKAPQNPFAPRTSLLRNLLLPEIQMTVSNLSQAIRFLVDNEFLDGVELKPGEANEKLIQVVDSETTEAS
ncbi:hypothetical protein BT96DRAFT_1054001 [Gymnopus androsaceus JB14]|uniref:FMR1-interacting protein 1 conserved domain-containing protein n=1 Tax=Gymnopus androsaceus JB14 TaxID=1447944 RepID=A0A6A4IQH5_9AGAR|nr:hypothetical protein BT96DRAFT_1054001 [Gymnopus androsaceus JB14]